MHNTARVARNEISQRVRDIEAAGGAFGDVRDLVSGQRGRLVYDNGDPDMGIWSVGLVHGLVRDIPTVDQLVRRIMYQAEDIIERRLALTIKSAWALLLPLVQNGGHDPRRAMSALQVPGSGAVS